MDNIVFLEPNKIDSEPFTTSKVIAETTGMNHRRVKDAIRKCALPSLKDSKKAQKTE